MNEDELHEYLNELTGDFEEHYEELFPEIDDGTFDSFGERVNWRTDDQKNRKCDCAGRRTIPTM